VILDLSLQEKAAPEGAAFFREGVTLAEGLRLHDRPTDDKDRSARTMDRVHMQGGAMRTRTVRQRDRQADLLSGALWLALACLAVLFALARP
jgi:hypothetical protein